MKFKFLLIFSVFLMSNRSEANYLDYHHVLNEARFYTLDNRKKIELFEKAFEMAAPFSEDAFALGNYYMKIEKKAKAKQYWKLAIALGKQFYPDDQYFEQFRSNYSPELSYLNPVDSTADNWLNQFLDQNYVKLRGKFLENSDKNTDYEQLLNAEHYFQSNREYYFNNYSDTMGYYCAYKYSYIVNSNLFLKLLASGDFPERRKTRRFNTRSISMLFNHVISGFNQHEDKVLHLLDLAYELVLEGEITPWEYASSYDHYINYFHPSKCLYGARFSVTENNEQQVCELLYPEKVDSLREAIALIPIRKWCEVYNFKLPVNYE